MARKRLTEKGIQGLKPATPGSRYDVMDADVPGLGVRVTDKGQRTFILIARYPGSTNPTRRALGEYGALGLQEAREKARAWHDLIRRGVDPKAEEERARTADQRRQSNTFEAVAEAFITKDVIGPDPANPRQRTGRETARDLRTVFIPSLGSRPIDSVAAHDILAVIDGYVTAGKTYRAHNLLGHVRRMFNWAINRPEYELDRSPCDRIKPARVIGPAPLRTRILTDGELRAFWVAAGQMDYPFGPLLRLLALLGQRKGEVADAEWSEFDLERRVWTIPAARTKANAVHVVPLTDAAIDILRALPRFDGGDFLFSTTFGRRPVSGFSKAKTRLDAFMLVELRRAAAERGESPDRTTLPEFVIHDVRRTMRTGLSSLPIPDMVRELVIGHTRPGLHKVYDQYSYLDEKREALELWGRRLRSIVEPAPANVVPLHAKGA
jgi:integrase